MQDEWGKCDVRNSNILEECGQVQFIFSDKTGTLTQNKMEFRQFTVDGKIYPNASFDFNENKKRYFEIETPESSKIKEFFKFTALCHKMVVEHENSVPKFQSSSPDEVALVNAAYKVGVVLEKVTKDKYFVNDFGNKETYQLLREFPFTSNWKR